MSKLTKKNLTANELDILTSATNYETAEAQRGDNHSNMILDRHDCKCLGLTVAEATKVAKRLEKFGLVFIDNTPEIGNVVYLTDAGIDLIFAEAKSEATLMAEKARIETINMVIAQYEKNISELKSELAELTK